MSAHQVILLVMAGFLVLGALDRIFGNRLGLGAEFEKGVLTTGPLILAMVGILCLAPVLAQWLRPVLLPVYQTLGADPAMFAGTLLACDMGGGPLAMELTDDRAVALFSGIIGGSMMGCTIVFTIPAAMGILAKEDQGPAAKGMLCGLVTIPLGMLAGGLTMGLPLVTVLKNLLPILLIALPLALGLWKAERAMIKGFVWFGKGILAVITVGFAAAALQQLTGFVVIPGMAPIRDGFITCGEIGVVLAGAFPLVYTVTKLLDRPLKALGRKIGINETAAAGLVATLANSIATFGMIREMDHRGKVLNMAFAVSAAFVFGDHLGYTGGFAPEMLPGLIVGKLTGGICALVLALLATGERKSKQEGRKANV